MTSHNAVYNMGALVGRMSLDTDQTLTLGDHLGIAGTKSNIRLVYQTKQS